MISVNLWRPFLTLEQAKSEFPELPWEVYPNGQPFCEVEPALIAEVMFNPKHSNRYFMMKESDIYIDNYFFKQR